MSNPAIIITAYNREDALAQLLSSLKQAIFPDTPVPLVISIDKSNNTKVCELAQAFDWPYGPKEITVHNNHLGLVGHMMYAIGLNQKYANLIVLEDDLYVSPFFYSYACDALNFYINDSLIKGISLYNYCTSECSLQAFIPIDDGSDVYFMQYPSSWGFCISAVNAADFLSAYHNKQLDDSSTDPLFIKSWGNNSWKKHMIRYLIKKQSYFAFPQRSLSTNFALSGTNTPLSLSMFQVPLQVHPKKFRFVPFNQSGSVYDCYFEITPACLNTYSLIFKDYNYVVDLQGFRDLNNTNATHVLTTRRVRKPMFTFGSALKPLINNVIKKIHGSGIYFAPVSQVSRKHRNIHFGHAEFLHKYRYKNLSGTSYIFRYLYYLIGIEFRMYLKKIFR